MPTSSFLFLPSIRKFTHTQISSFHCLIFILITAISLLCYCESQSFPGWPYLRKQTSGDTILNCLTFSIHLLAAQVVLLWGLLFWGSWDIFSFDSASIFDSASYFGTFFFFALIQFLTCTGTEKNSLFVCFLHLLQLRVIRSDFLSQASL